MNIERKRGERKRKKINRERDNLTTIEMERGGGHRKMNGGTCNANYSSIEAVAIVGDSPIDDVPSLALSRPDQLPVLLQGQFIEAPTFES